MTKLLHKELVTKIIQDGAQLEWGLLIDCCVYCGHSETKYFVRVLNTETNYYDVYRIHSTCYRRAQVAKVAQKVKVICKRCNGDGLYGRETMFGYSCLECDGRGYLMLDESAARKYEAQKAYIAHTKEESAKQLAALETVREAQELAALEKTYTMRGVTYQFEIPTDLESAKRLEWLRANSRKYCATAEYYLDKITDKELLKKLNAYKMR